MLNQEPPTASSHKGLNWLQGQWQNRHTKGGGLSSFPVTGIFLFSIFFLDFFVSVFFFLLFPSLFLFFLSFFLLVSFFLSFFLSFFFFFLSFFFLFFFFLLCVLVFPPSQISLFGRFSRGEATQHVTLPISRSVCPSGGL